MRNIEEESAHVITHAEESSARLKADSADRQNIQKKLDTCIDPINPAEHSTGVLNIVSGRIGNECVNVDDALAIGMEQMIAFENTWPEGFHSKLINKVVTMAINQKGVTCEAGTIYDTDLIYGRVIGLMSSRSVDLKDVLSHELSTVPTSMFDNNGNMKKATSKATLKGSFHVLVN
ncbi:hypothetical protein DPMN_053423 [Dreissena polymorpha]|uniref:Uncharacterized protein n=1 Tax=Dreissena polymorpha TaxID=45954 RepID=A0A9D4CLB6_DREPO|nr:hypothetical protein DPMN_053423 [Dreissena polymorpha]